jgi:hypothetical protein
MPPKLQLKFDTNQEHQFQAVESVVRLFEGMPRYEEAFRPSDDMIIDTIMGGESRWVGPVASVGHSIRLLLVAIPERSRVAGVTPGSAAGETRLA